MVFQNEASAAPHIGLQSHEDKHVCLILKDLHAFCLGEDFRKVMTFPPEQCAPFIETESPCALREEEDVKL